MNRTRTQPSAPARGTPSLSRDLVLGFHGVRYQVKDVRRSVEFYTKHLGFKLGHEQLPAFADVSIASDARRASSGARWMEPHCSSGKRSSGKN